MSEVYWGCTCGFKSVESQLAKTAGACPKCGRRTAANRSKYAEETTEQTDMHITSKQVK